MYLEGLCHGISEAIQEKLQCDFELNGIRVGEDAASKVQIELNRIRWRSDECGWKVRTFCTCFLQMKNKMVLNRCKFNIGSKLFRKCAQLEEIRNFLRTAISFGFISRIEETSALPTIMLDIQAHHNVHIYIADFVD